MCGITGVFGKLSTEKVEEFMSLAMDSYQYRGPDDRGIAIYPTTLHEDYSIGLGNIRLSIQDLSIAGHQPMEDYTKRYCIAFNGEIYNFKEIRTRLEEKNIVFKSNCDTEVLVNAFSIYKESLFQMLNGMFALIIYDKEENELFVARDQFSIKPLYYAKCDTSIMFVSEPKGLIDSDYLKFEVNKRILIDFLSFGMRDHTDETFFENIKRFPPGYWAKVSSSFDLEFKPFFNISSLRYSESEISEFYKDLEQKLLKSVEYRLIADVPIGINLSGGLDSSILASLASKINNRPFKVFTATVPGNPFDESGYAEKVVKKNNFEWIKVIPSKNDFLNEFRNVITAQGEPFGNLSVVFQYFVFKKIKEEKITVVLGGQGGDELFAGYNHYIVHHFRYLGAKFRWKKLYNLIKSQSKFNETKFKLKDYFYYIFTGLLNWYLPSSIKKFQLKKKVHFIEPATLKQFFDYKRVGFGRKKSLRDHLIEDYLKYQIPSLMAYEDRNSMYFSIEARIPFLDPNIVDLAFSSPEEFNFRSGILKHSLRKTFEKYLDPEIAWRKTKYGFIAPNKLWMMYLKGEIKSVFREKCWIFNFVKENYLKSLIARYDNLSSTSYEIVLRCYNAELWFRNFNKNKDS